MSYPPISDNFQVDLLNRKEFYSLKADAAHNFRDPGGEDTLMSKHLSIHSHQLFVGNLMNPNTPYKRLHLSWIMGTGKCHAKDTPIMMYDGSVKKVQDVRVGDKLMGDDSTPRNVLSLARGRETMVKVVPIKGDPFICNKSHILSLVCNNKLRKTYNQTVDISISDYMKASRGFKDTHKLYRVPVNFPERPVEIPPYMIGFWLGDGCSYHPMITTQDAKIVQYFTQEVVKFGAYLQYKSKYDYYITTGNRGGQEGSNRFLTTLQKYDLIKNKHIPDDYKINSRENRLQLLAGMLDSDGYYDKASNVFEFVQKSERIIDDFIYLCRSLGFAAYKITCIKRCTNSKDPNHSDTYYRSFISGDLDQIPTKLDRKRAGPRKQPKDVRRVGFSLEELPEDDYYGFVIDGNHRYLMGDFIVTHNTLGAIYIASKFIRVYKKMYANLEAKTQASRRNRAEMDRNTPTVFVLGFGGPKQAFIRDLLKYPDFGFISLSEKEELDKRRRVSESGLPDDVKNFRDYYSMLKKRITNKSKDGFFTFFGYDEFVNRLFHTEPGVKLTDLEAVAIQKLRAGENVTLEDIFAEYIQNGKIQVNTEFLARFDRSLLICDEIHETYNMNMKNNRGVAIQYVLDSVPSLRFLSLSATPINNAPTEVVELVNYLVPKEQKITKKAFFSNSRTLLPGKLKELGELFKGRISFIQDVNVKYFPRREFNGAPYKLPHQVGDLPAGSNVPYLKFIECPMSEFHYNTYEYMLAHASEQRETATLHVDSEPETTIDPAGNIIEELVENEPDSTLLSPEDAEEGDAYSRADDEVGEMHAVDAPTYSYHSIPTDGYSIYDIVFPNPESTTVGIFRSSEMRAKIVSASQTWRDENKIAIKKFSALNNLITGDFLLRQNIPKYSTKYAKLIDLLLEIIRSHGGDPQKCQKVMIYHDRVKMSGVLLIQELLKANGFIDEISEPTDNTLCCICGDTLAGHTGQHQYHPARFVMAHSDIDKLTMDQSLTKYNTPDNSHGLKYMILVGAKIIKQSYDFKDVQQLIITSLPINIPTLLQVFGRCIRKNSHINLPPDQRRVLVSILVSTINPSLARNDTISPEIYKYIDKLADYVVIQNIQREQNRNAIDADINRDIIMPPELLNTYFPNGTDSEPDSAQATIDPLYFEPSYKIPQYSLADLKTSTFTAYRYYEDEIRTISFIIKRLFMMQPVWTYDDLWAKVQKPPIGLEMNPQFFQENNFIIALSLLLEEVPPVVSARMKHHEMTESMLIERLFDTSDRYIYVGANRHKIVQVDKYYILFPIEDIPSNPLNVVYTEYTEHVRDKERAMIKELSEPNDRVIVDVETYQRPHVLRSGIRLSIDDYVKSTRSDINYANKKQQFYARMNAVKDNVPMYQSAIIDFLVEYSAKFQMMFLEEAIAHTISNKLLGNNTEQSKIQDDIIDLLHKFGAIIYMKELRKYRDVAKNFKHGLPDLPDDTPIGYVATKSVRLYDPLVEKYEITELEATAKVNIELPSTVKGKWIEINKISLNRQFAYKENDIVVGFLETAEDYMKFKLRKPIQKIKEDVKTAKKVKKDESTVASDTRLIERGIVCSTKNKNELIQIIAQLGVSTHKLDKLDIRIKRLCDIIRQRLIELEMKERARDSRYKYLYSWWDTAVVLTS